MRKIIILVIVLHCLLFSLAQAEDDFQYWSQYSLQLYNGQKAGWTLFGDMRFMEDAEKLGLYYFSPRFKYDAWEHLSLGINYTYLNSRNTSPAAIKDDYNWQHRLEVEANPHWDIGQWLKLHIRNRYEFRWVEDKGAFNDRFRQRWTFSFPLKHKSLKSIYASSEIFYNFAEHEYNENRSVPLGLNFRITDKAAFSLYYMVQSQKEADDWSSNQILGTLVSYKF